MTTCSSWLLSGCKILGECLSRIKIGIAHLLWNLTTLLVNVEVVGCHVHVADRNQRGTHINANSTALVSMVILVVVANVADVGWSSSSCLQILHALAKLGWIWCLLLRLSLVGQIRFIAIAVCGQFALRWISILIYIDTRVHLFGLFRSNGSTLGARCIIWLSLCPSHLVSFALSWALNPIGLWVCPNLWDLIVCLSRCAISKGLTYTKLLFEVLLGLLSYQFPSLWSARTTHWRSTIRNVPRIITIGDSSIFRITWLICQCINHRLLSRSHLMLVHSWSHLSGTCLNFSCTRCDLVIFHWLCSLILTIFQLNDLVTLTAILLLIVLNTFVALYQILLLLAIQWGWVLWSLRLIHSPSKKILCSHVILLFISRSQIQIISWFILKI